MGHDRATHHGRNPLIDFASITVAIQIRQTSSNDNVIEFHLHSCRDENGHSCRDVNGDGMDDIISGAYAADPNGNSFAGKIYVVFDSPNVLQ